jgi:hypothetical protein
VEVLAGVGCGILVFACGLFWGACGLLVGNFLLADFATLGISCGILVDGFGRGDEMTEGSASLTWGRGDAGGEQMAGEESGDWARGLDFVAGILAIVFIRFL